MSTYSELPGVFCRAAYIIQMNGHHQGDYVPDPFNRVLTTPKLTRPMSVAAALYCAADPQGRMVESQLASAAIRFLAGRALVDGEGPWDADRDTDCEIHIAEWGDLPGRTGAEVIRLLLDAAQSLEVRVLAPTAAQVVLGREVRAA
jgi:hypothetical protein